ncbi:hypothetical protein D3C86_1932220 [compost metagenome]
MIRTFFTQRSSREVVRDLLHHLDVFDVLGEVLLDQLRDRRFSSTVLGFLQLELDALLFAFTEAEQHSEEVADTE